MTFEGHMPTSMKVKPCRSPSRKYTQEAISIYQDSIAAHLSNILNSENYSTVISSARFADYMIWILYIFFKNFMII